MNTFILNSESSNQPIEQLLRQAQLGGVEVRDSQGNVIAFILSPSDHAKWAYADAHGDLDKHKSEVQQALNRSGGITTAELLEKAASKAPKDDLGMSLQFLKGGLPMSEKRESISKLDA